MPYVRYTAKSNGTVYASLVSAVRTGSRVKQQYVENLGRVVNRDEGIFCSRERGLFRYSPTGGFEPLAVDGASVGGKEKERLILDFGDCYFLSEYIKSQSYCEIFADIIPRFKDTLFSLLFYRILTDKKACCYGETWWRGSYASILFPAGDLRSQRISEFLEVLADEQLQRRFFERYIHHLYGKGGATGILIDSSSVSNASKMSITQMSNHNGEIDMGARLIYVLDSRNGMPIYFRYCPGNIIDVTTLCTTIAELKQLDVSVEHAIMDAGYFSEENVRKLYSQRVQFITRLAPNRKLFKQVTDENLPGLMQSKNALKYGERLLYMKKVQVDIFGNTGYAYIAIDMDSRNQQIKRSVFASIEDQLSDDETDNRTARLGLFMILSSADISTQDILPLYYTRQQIEQVFDIGKNSADLLPTRVHKEETLRGHLLLTFLATIVLQGLQKDIIAERKKKDKINSEGIFMNLRNQKCKVYSKEVIPQEPVKQVNEIYKLFKMDLPISIPRQCSEN